MRIFKLQFDVNDAKCFWFSHVLNAQSLNMLKNAIWRATRFYSEISVISSYCTKLSYDFRYSKRVVDYFYELNILKKNPFNILKKNPWNSDLQKYNHIRKGENGEGERERDRKQETEQAVISILSPFVFVFRVCAHDFPSHCLCSEIQENCMTHFETNAAVYKSLTKRWLNQGLSLLLSHSLSHQSLIHFNYSQKPESHFYNSLTSRLRPLFCTSTFV